MSEHLGYEKHDSAGRRDFDDSAGAEDAVRGLRTAGPIYQTSDGYVFATRAACRMVEIVGKVI